MLRGLKLFEKFDNLYLEVCVPDNDRKRFEHDYGLRTGINPTNYVDGYNTRKRKTVYNAWGIEYRIYFKTSVNWVVDSLKKLGFHTEISDKLIAVEFNGEHPENGYKHRVTNQQLFWWLVDYGYRLGENSIIPYELFCMKKHLKELKIEPLFEIDEIEVEDAIFEAQMLAEVA